MNTTAYKKDLLAAWEDVFKKGQLTLWVLLALKDGNKHMAAILDFVTQQSTGILTIEEQSLYRSLRRYHQTGIIEYVTVPGNKGPARKEYALTELGKQVLQEFLERNIIALYYKTETKKLIERR